MALNATGPLAGFYRWTLLYPLHPSGGLAHLERNSVMELRAGGGHVKLTVPILSGGEEPTGGFQGGGGPVHLPLIAFTGRVEDTIGGKAHPINDPHHDDSPYAALRVRVTWNDTLMGVVSDVWERNANDRPGRMIRGIFDVTEPTGITHPTNPNAPNPAFKGYTFLGRDKRSHAARVQVVDFQDRIWCFVADFGGSVLVYELTDVLDSAPDTIFKDAEHAVWYAPESISDNLPRNIPDLLADVGEETLLLYVSVWRHGLAVLEFKPDESDPADRLVRVKTIQTPGRPAGLAFREVNGERQLLVSDETGGFRIYRQPGQQSGQE